MVENIEEACEKHWENNKSNCSGFVRAVANEFGVSLYGNANAIVDTIQGEQWTILKDGRDARDKAADGLLVIAGLKADEHGHVAIITPGPLAHDKYPVGYWGKFNGEGKKSTTINWAWNKVDRDNVIYGAIMI